MPPSDNRTPQQKIFDSVRQDIHTLDSKISLVAQKLRTIEQNEEIIGRTIVAHNEKMKELDEKFASGGSSLSGSSDGVSSKEIIDLKKQMEDLRKEIGEMRYVLNSINPLEFATLDQVKDLLKEKKG
jgi:chromosome segregation ATPase